MFTRKKYYKKATLLHRQLLKVLFVIILCNNISFSQTINIDDVNFTTNQLVNNIVGNGCIPTSNHNLSSNRSVAHFNINGNFPITEGIIIRNGIAKQTEGIYNNQNLSSQINSNGDNQLQQLSDDNGQTSTITDVAFLEFNFTPLSNNLSFNFVFASNEYGEWQCGFSDIFAIFLTNLETGEVINMAVVPGTNTNVSVKNIRDQEFNNSCFSINENYFDTYNVNNPSSSSLNMRGYTKKINASATVTPLNSYKIKFVIGDYNDSNYDSAVFIEANSFTSNVNLGENIETCLGSEVTLDTGFGNVQGYNYEWQLNGITIANESSSTLTTSNLGTYRVIITDTNSNCELTDEIIVTELQVNSPENLFQCDTSSTFDLTQNNHNTLGLNQEEYQVFYYNSLDNVTNNIPIENNLLTTYSSSSQETIYIKLFNIATQQFCDTTLSFDLNFINVNATTPQDLEICASNNIINLISLVESEILNGLNINNYNVSYFFSDEDAINNTNPITNPSSFSLPTNISSLTLSAKVTSTIFNDCYDIVNFTININPTPPVDVLENVYICTEYILEPLTHGNYYTEPNGNGTLLNEGEVITTSSTIYIFNQDENGCINQSSFMVVLAGDYLLSNDYCGQFVVPTYQNANFYTATGGPNGTGTLIPTGTILTQSQSIYFYASTSQGDFCVEKEFEINIIPFPLVDSFENVITCDSYTLPEIDNGRFYTQSNGNGIQLFPGDNITASQRVYIYNTFNNCSNSSSFNVSIIDSNSFQNIEACGSYTLPNLTFGNYYTEANGNGEIIPQGSVINSSQTIFYYANEVTINPNCTENISFNININPIPNVDSIENIISCENNLPVLPIINNGNYFTQPNGQGNQLLAGDTINTSQTIYIYNTNENCSAQSNFTVEIRGLPLVDNFTDIYSCDPYELPVLNNGNYYSEPNGQGEQLLAGQFIESTQTIYIYNEYSDLTTCNNQNIFEVRILGVEVDELEDVIACEEYVLPSLNVGNYYTESGGNGNMLLPGQIINQTQSLYIYAENGDRFFCYDEHLFTINIYTKPSLDFIENIEGCGSITLQDYNTTNRTVEYYTGPNQSGLIDPSEYTFTVPGTKAIYVRAFPPENPNCFSEKVIVTRVFPLLDLYINNGIICVDYDTGETTNPILLESRLNPNEFTVNWYLDGVLVNTGPDYLAIKAGTYIVETTKLTPDIGNNCNYKPTEVLVESSSPKFEIQFLTDDFSANYNIKVEEINSGLGNYIYSLDGADFQVSPYFYNILPGEHIITIKDTSGICENITLDFLALAYPKFFTPNFDGINDTWNIKDLKNNFEAVIKIFDRFGKPITIIKPNGPGWTGLNSNGKKMPSTDYWFVVEYNLNGINKQFRANFSLLRKK